MKLPIKASEEPATNPSIWTDRTPTAMGQSDADKEEPAGQHPIATDRDAAEMIR